MLAEYYQKSKEKLSKKTLERYQNLSEEEKKRQFACKQYKNLSDKKEKEKRQSGRKWYKNFC